MSAPAIDSGLKTGLGAAALSLMASTSTLLCCALPALFVALGAGAALAGLVSAAPWLVWLSAHKALTFGTAGGLLLLAGGLLWRARSLPARGCERPPSRSMQWRCCSICWAWASHSCCRG